jgi:anti-sigma factor RsiW
MSPCADKELLLHGLLDGELDALNTLAIEAHLKECAGCAAQFEQLLALRARLRNPTVRYEAPPALRARVMAQVGGAGPSAGTVRPRRPRVRKIFVPWALGGAVTALAACLAFVVLVHLPGQRVADELVASHVRSLLAAHLMDVETSDRHVVKPWFAGKVDFAPPVIDLTEQGFPLAGGRLDYVRGRVVAAVVYRRRQHVINVFVWPVSGAPVISGTSRRDGYNLVSWQRGGLQFWAVSDLEAGELQQLRAELGARTAD